ncbi:hypothetical protein RHGRI_014549 [Rhododendron griersonianum]|uniref:EF hand associated type-2 domain-containing protein n=1 Tax=Rhododendron griersonianum TaxID=479676 RepID=A0AAV6K9T9_9ERIC|nr:hypothetical protein RHGRI_014549 [Rhododendron griersonianum]
MAGGGADARSGVRIVVAGDRGTGKSSFIATAATRTFPINVPSLLPPTRLPDDLYPDRVPVTIIDTSSWSLSLSLSLSLYVYITQPLSSNINACVMFLNSVLSMEENWPNNLNGLMLSCLLMRVISLPHLTAVVITEQVKVPVMVVGCKLDLRDDKHPLNLEQVMSPIMQQFQEIETCIECSAFKQIQEAQTLKPQCLRALKQIFILCDHDRDGRLKTTWTVLRKFGYNNDIRLNDDHLPPPVKRAPDQLFRQIEWEIDKHGI